MDNHNIVVSALQKYYSALKSLNEFGQQGNFFDDVSNLDQFFSEFRNITFVIQKALESEENRIIYTELRTKFLSDETSKWFVETRNKTTKEKPFNLKKELQVDLYLPNALYTIRDIRLVVDFDISFNDALEYIRSVFFDEFKLVEVYFTSRVIVKDSDGEIDFYPKIKAGILQMDKFMVALEESFPCDCQICERLKKLTAQLSQKVKLKELIFTHDYSLEKGKDLHVGDQAEMGLSVDGIEYTAFSDLRVSLNNQIFKETQGFVIDTGEQIIPVEVKAEVNLKAKSLRTYHEKFSPEVSVRTSMADYKKEDWIINLPLYAVGEIGSLTLDGTGESNG